MHASRPPRLQRHKAVCIPCERQDQKQQRHAGQDRHCVPGVAAVVVVVGTNECLVLRDRIDSLSSRRRVYIYI